MDKSKRNELATLLRRLADYVENRSDQELVPLFEHAARLLPSGPNRKRPSAKTSGYLHEIASQLGGLPSRERGEALLRDKGLNRDVLEALARYLQLPVQRDDTIEKLRAKIIENIIGSRLRSDAIRR